MIWLLAGIGAGAVVVAFVGAVVALVGRQSYERRGTLELDTPEARAALRNGRGE